MKSKHFILLLFGLLSLTLISKATLQVQDRLIWNEEEYPFFENPLEEYFYQGNEKPDVLDSQFSHCRRGYCATFELDNSKLYLVKLEKLIRKRDPWWSRWKKKKDNDSYEWKELPLSLVFPEQKAPLFAQWYTGELSMPQGELLEAYRDTLMLKVYEKDIVVSLVEGIVTDIEIRDNKKPENSTNEK